MVGEAVNTTPSQRSVSGNDPVGQLARNTREIERSESGLIPCIFQGIPFLILTAVAIGRENDVLSESQLAGVIISLLFGAILGM